MTPLERAARALCNSRHPELWDDDLCSEDIRDSFRKAVRVVLTAIREPSEGMMQALYDGLKEPYPEPRAIFPGMIDAALAEGE